MNEEELEAEIKAKGLTAPRLTPELIDAQIVDEWYANPEGTTATICMLTLRNGFQTIAHSACVSAANFDYDIGKRLAREKARDKIWELEGYRLACDLAKAA